MILLSLSSFVVRFVVSLTTLSKLSFAIVSEILLSMLSVNIEKKGKGEFRAAPRFVLSTEWANEFLKVTTLTTKYLKPLQIKVFWVLSSLLLG